MRLLRAQAFARKALQTSGLHGMVIAPTLKVSEIPARGTYRPITTLALTLLVLLALVAYQRSYIFLLPQMWNVALNRAAANVTATYQGLPPQLGRIYQVRSDASPPLSRRCLQNGRPSGQLPPSLMRPPPVFLLAHIFSNVWPVGEWLSTDAPVQTQLSTGLKSYSGRLFTGAEAISKFSAEPYVAPMLQARRKEKNRWCFHHQRWSLSCRYRARHRPICHLFRRRSP